MTARHEHAMRQMMPLGLPTNLGPEWECWLAVEGVRLDELEAKAFALLDEMFPGNIELLIADWERVFAITPPSGASLADRNAVIYAAWRAVRGLLRRDHFENIARGLGYTIGSSGTYYLQIIDGSFLPFRADISAAGDRVYDNTAGSAACTWQVIGTNVESDTELQRLFRKFKTFGSEVTFTNA